ncbi:endosialidase-like protein [Naumannella halotolerans]|uniref:Endosialidase-like protein n=2 Tax=Naumannella halotolerans TaxID=993414 RepID=A0A4R7J200_9ACTN|nr:endosialidase-like protein [Naumannella halotolerans]
MRLRLVLYRGNTEVTVLDDAIIERFADPLNDPSTVAFSLPRWRDGEPNSYPRLSSPDVITDGYDVAVQVATPGKGWREVRNGRLRVLVEGTPGRAEGDMWTFSGINAVWWDMGGCVLADRNLNENNEREFRNATPGTYLQTFLTEAQDEGCGTLITETFSTSGDTEGVVWPQTITFAVPLTMTMQEMIKTLSDQGLVDWWTEGNELVTATPGRGRRLDDTVHLKLGREITDTPGASDATGVVNHVRVIGENGLRAWHSQGDGGPRGKRAVVMNQSGVTDAGAALVLATHFLAKSQVRRQQYTRELRFDFTDDPAMGAAAFFPYEDYLTGDWVTAPGRDGVDEAMRVYQILLSSSPDGMSGNLQLNDRILDADVRRDRKLAALSRGTSGGTGTSPSPTTPKANAPGKVQGITTDSDPYMISGGEWRIATRIMWLEPSKATSSITYDMEYMQVNRWWYYPVSGIVGTDYSVSNLLPETEYQVRVRGVNPASDGGLAGEWSDWAYFMTVRDEVPPEKPTVPQLSSDLGTVKVMWDEKLVDPNGGVTAPPPDFLYVSVEADVAGAGWEEVDQITVGSPFTVIAPLDPGTVLQVRLVAVDTSGNRSEYSVLASITVRGVLDDPDTKAILDQAQADIDEAQTALDALNQQLADLDIAELAALSERLDQLNADIAQLEAALAELDAEKIAELTSDLEQLQTDLADLDTQLQGLNADNLPGLAAKFTQRDNAIAAANTQINTLNNTTIPNLNTALNNLDAELAQAQTDLNGAIDAAEQAAKDYADVVSVNNAGNKVTRSANPAPSDYSGKPGDFWMQVDSSGGIIAQWGWSGSVWYGTPITDSVIANLDAGKITSGIIEANRIGANTITTEKLVIGFGGNLVADPAFQYDDITANRVFPAGSPTTIFEETTGKRRLQLSQNDQRIYAGGVRMFAGHIPVKPGQAYRFEWASNHGGEAGSQLVIDDRGLYGTGPTRFFTLASRSGGGAQAQSVEWVVPEGVYSIGPRWCQVGEGWVQFWDMAMYEIGTTTTIMDGAITTDKIVANAIVGSKIAADTLTAREIAANAITASELAANSVTANAVAANAITAGKINADAVTARELAANSVTASQIAANAVTANAIAANAITTAKISAGAVVANSIATDAVTAIKIAANAVTTAKIMAGAVTANEIAASTITGEKIAARSIAAEKLIIGDATNLLSDGFFSNSGAGWTSAGATPPGTVMYQVAPQPSGANGVVLSLTDLATNGGYLFNQAFPFAGATRTQMEPGRQFRFTVTMRRLSGAAVSGGEIRFGIGGHGPGLGNAWITAVGVQVASVGTAWTTYTGTATFPDSRNEMSAYINVPANSANKGTLQIASVIMTPMSGATLIEDGAILTDKLGANAVTAVKIAAGAVTASKLTVGFSENLVDDAGNYDTDIVAARNSVGGWVVNGRTWEATNNHSMINNVGNLPLTINPVSVSAGAEYVLRVTIARASGDGEVVPQLLFVDSNGDQVSAVAAAVTNAGSDRVLTLTIPRSSSGTGRFYVSTNSAGAYVGRFSKATLRARVDATVIEDGAITTDKLTANAVTADKVSAGAITGAKISGDAIDGMVITGATLRTRTATAGSVRMNSNGIQAWNASGAQVVNIGTNGTAYIGTSGNRMQFADGNLTVEGTIRTSPSVPRVELNNALWADGLTGIRFYTRSESGNRGHGEVWSDTDGQVLMVSGRSANGNMRRGTVRVRYDEAALYSIGTNNYVAAEVKTRANGDIAMACNELFFSGIPARGGGSGALRLQGDWSITYDTSMRQFKENIVDLPIEAEGVLKLRPRLFDWKEGGQSDVGVIVEEVEELIEEHPELAPLITHGPEGSDVRGFAYDHLAVLLVPIIRRMAERITRLETLLEES